MAPLLSIFRRFKFLSTAWMAHGCMETQWKNQPIYMWSSALSVCMFSKNPLFWFYSSWTWEIFSKCVCVCVCAQSCLILCNAMDCSQAPLEFSRQEYWSEVPFPTPGDLSYPGIEPTSLESPALAGGFLTCCLWGRKESDKDRPRRGRGSLLEFLQPSLGDRN